MTMNCAMQTRRRITQGFVEWRMELRSVSGLEIPVTVAAAGGSAVVVHHFDVIAVRVEDEGRVIPIVVDGPLAGSAVVAVAGRGRGGVEGVNRRVVGGRERPVEMLGRLARDQRERAALGGEAHAVGSGVPESEA